MSDTPGEPAAPDPVPLYAISEVALNEIEGVIAVYGNPDKAVGVALGFIRAARENGPVPEIAALDARIAALYRELGVTHKQREFLMGLVDSLIQRLSGAHVAAGLLAMPAAQGFMQKEVFPINQVLAQIEQAEKPTP